MPDLARADASPPPAPTWTTAHAAPGRPDVPGRASPTAASCACATAREAMARGDRGTCAGRREAAGLRPLLRLAAPSSTSSRCRTSSTATSTRRSTSLRPLRPALRAAAPRRRSAGSTASVRRVLRRRAAAPAVQLPVDVRRARAVRGARRCTRSSPTWTRSTASSFPTAAMHAAADRRWPPAAEQGRRSTFRYGAPVERIVLADGDDGPGARRAAGRRRAARRPTPSCATPTSPVAYRTLLPGLTPPRAAPRAADYSPSARRLARRRARRAARRARPTTTSTSARQWDERVPGADRRRRADARPVDPRHRADGRRPGDGARPAATSLYVLEPVPEPRRPRSTGRRERDAGRATTCAPASTGSATRVDVEVEHLVDPTDWERRRAWSGARRSRSSHRFLQTGPFRPGQRRTPGARAGASPAAATVPGVGVPMVLVSGELAAERVGGPAAMIDRPTSTAATLERRYADCRAAEPPPRHDLLLGDVRCSRPRSATTSTPSTASAGYADDIVDDLGDRRRPSAARRRSAAFGDRLFARPRRRSARDDPVLAAVVAHGPRVRHRPGVLRPVPALDGDGPRPSTRYETWDDLLRLHGRLGRGDRRDDAADPRAARRRRAPARPATSASRSSSPTSCATSARTSTAAGCTCRRRTCAASAPTRRRAPVDARVARR